MAIHSTNYVNVKGNVAFDIIGHMCAVQDVASRMCCVTSHLDNFSLA